MTHNRSKFIGSSEIAALFDCHPFLSRWELWQRKAGNIDAPDLDNVERVQWGNWLEAGIAHGLAQMHGWSVAKADFIEHPKIQGMSATPDYWMFGHKIADTGILEIKNVDYLQWRDWENNEPPLAYILQLQHQLACTGLNWGRIGYLVSGNTSGFNEYQARPKIIKAIEDAVEQFWQSIRDNKPPKPDFMVDADLVSKLYKETAPGRFLDLRGNNHLAVLCADYLSAAAEQSDAEKRKQAAKAEIFTLADTATEIWASGYTIKSTSCKGTADRVISAADVGTIIKGRSGYRNITITQKEIQ